MWEKREDQSEGVGEVLPWQDGRDLPRQTHATADGPNQDEKMLLSGLPTDAMAAIFSRIDDPCTLQNLTAVYAHRSLLESTPIAQ